MVSRIRRPFQRESVPAAGPLAKRPTRSLAGPSTALASRVELRAYTAGDAQATSVIFLRAVRETARAHYSLEQVEAWAANYGDLDSWAAARAAAHTLVERTTNYTMLLHLPDGYTPELVRDALAAKIKTLPEALRASLTWDQSPEMGKWKQVSVDADIDIFFCDPHAPWQRATNENTNGLLRQYFPKSSDLSAHSADDLDWVAAELNDRPRKRLGFKKPIEQIGPLLLR